MDPQSPENHCNPALQQLWRDLLAGSLKIPSVRGDGFELVLADAVAPAPTARRAHRQACLDAALRGEPQKALATDFNAAASTISNLLRSAAADMGVPARLSKIPAALALLAHAAHGAGVVSLREVGAGGDPSLGCILNVSYSRKILESSLSPREQDVTKRFITGESYEQIALARGVSRRTVANQLAHTFQRLRASGRLALLRRLIERGAALGMPVTFTLRSARLEQPAALRSPEEEASWPRQRHAVG